MEVKKIFFLVKALLWAAFANCQPSLHLVGIRDAYTNVFDYTGQTMDSKPEGRGLGLYQNGDRFFGLFHKGLAQGHGVLFFADGRVLIADFDRGKARGEVVFQRKDGSIYVGGFEHDNYNGFGKVLTANNLFTSGWYKNGSRDGLGLEIGENGFIFQGNYIKDQRNGSGMQFEPLQKKLFQGIWKDNRWVKEEANDMVSFMKEPDFNGFNQATKIMAAKIDSTRPLINDSALLFRPKTHERSFGWFKDGVMMSGFHATGDSIRYWGSWGPKGGDGWGIYAKKGQYLGAGYFDDGKLDSLATYVNIDKKSIYEGEMNDGKLTGKGVFLNSANTIMEGTFLDGDLEGQGSILLVNGVRYAGGFTHGRLMVADTITTAAGTRIDCHPTEPEAGVQILLDNYKNRFDIFKGASKHESLLILDTLWQQNNSFFLVPQAKSNAILNKGDSSVFIADLMDTTDRDAATDLYKKLTAQVKQMRPTLGDGSKTYKLKATTMADEKDDMMVTVYSFPGKDKEQPRPNISIVRKHGDNRYQVYLLIGEKYMAAHR